MHNITRIALGSAAALAVTGTAALAATSTKATGNQGAISFAAKVQKAYNSVPGVSYTQTGYIALHSSLGTTSTFAWQGGAGTVPKGWARASEKATVALSDGRVQWAQDTLTPIDCVSSAGCVATPVEMLQTRTNAYWRIVASSSACFNKLNTSTQFAYGDDWFTFNGTFYALGRKGASTTVLRFAFPYTKTQTASATDDVTTSTKLISAQTIKVGKGLGSSHPAFTISTAYTTLRSAPTEPTVKVCS